MLHSPLPLSRMDIPDINDVYRIGVELTLYEPGPGALPDLPPMIPKPRRFPVWPICHLSPTLQERLRTDPLSACYADSNRVEKNRPQLPAMSIRLENSLAGGFRDDRPAQVWEATGGNPTRRLVARIYDPLYYDDCATNRFAIIKRSVAIENEAYRILQDYQGTSVPHFCGVFVAEILGCPQPRYVYVVLLEYIPGNDLRDLMTNQPNISPEHSALMKDPAKTCPEHRVALIDAAARLLYIFFPLGIIPDDMAERNIVLRIPSTESTEDFCDFELCPWQRKIHIDLTFPRTTPEHPYAPHMWMIDFEYTKFLEKERSIWYCRNFVASKWPIVFTKEARQVLSSLE
ncbi:hypothetical protein C8R43DRAFT_993939 [Mycena crocata]|nr:hypothetical protein C8R43DRAFT_993939 [Mycena crocata]